MMTLQIDFQGDVEDLKEGMAELESFYKFKTSADGIPIKVKKRSGLLNVSLKNGHGLIEYDQTIHFFRGLGLFLEAIKDKDLFEIKETPQFKTNGIMVDCSRNAVMKPETIYKLLRYMGVMGLNMLMLYTEDTYSIEGEPFFGYLRGRYSEAEIKAIDDYAYQFGIEVIPCIQTLGHMSMVLKWPAYGHIRDNESVLLAGAEATYEFIDKMIDAATRPLRSKRIHLGMDEAWGMGRGQYMDRFGYKESLEIFNDHMEQVLKIAKKYDLDPMIWSDTYLNILSNQKQPADDTNNHISDGLKLIYWDYFTRDKQFYHDTIQKHKQLGAMPIFSGGVVACSTFAANSARTFESSIPALTACKEEGVEEVFVTIWGDDAAEYHPFTALLGFQLYAEMGYAKDLDMDKLKRRVKFCTGIEFDAFMDLSMLDNVENINQDNRWPPNVSKYVFWQDPLLGLHDKDIEGLELDQHYKKVHKHFLKRYQDQESVREYYEVPLKLSAVLSIKSEIGNRMRAYYKNEDTKSLEEISEHDLPELIKRVEEMRKVHRKQWHHLNKPFGWEVLDLRYSGLIGRLDSTIYRLKEYLSEEIDRIQELEEEILPLDMTANGLGNGIWRKYKQIATANVLLE